MNSSPSNDSTHCPLCGEHNFCAVASNPQAKDCWCMHSRIKPELIEQARRQQAPRDCICQACAEKADKLAYASTHKDIP